MHSDNGRNERNESHLERYDRNLVELLQEVRVAQTGVQVLFAFLLGLAFTSRLGQATPLQRVDYLVTLISSAMAALLLIAPGRLPVLAGGNADVDIEMLTAAKFAVLVNHDDSEREFAYTSGAEQSLAKAKEQGWNVVSMKNDWITVF
jgi:hypothetical protein